MGLVGKVQWMVLPERPDMPLAVVVALATCCALCCIVALLCMGRKRGPPKEPYFGLPHSGPLAVDPTRPLGEPPVEMWVPPPPLPRPDYDAELVPQLYRGPRFPVGTQIV